MWTDEQKKKQRQWMETYHQRDTSGRYTAFSECIVCPACQTKFIRCLEKRMNGKWLIGGAGENIDASM